VDVVGIDEASIVVGWVGTFVTCYRSDVASPLELLLLLPH
jgi:hypothetical protein